MRIVLFLCPGNYYRSRFAELLFNALAERAGLDWRADSAGLAAEASTPNIGPISRDTVRELARRRIAVETPLRYPRHVRAADLAGAARVIALNEGEHRPMLAEQFPEWAERAEFWHIPDLDQAPPTEGLGAVERKVEILIQELGRPA
jgi:protein-tyrosine phosphatase